MDVYPDSPELMAHQREGVRFLIERKVGLLAFEQGLGKTLVAIKAFADLRARGSVETLFVVCPNSLKRNWVAELRTFAPDMDAAIIEGTPRTRRFLLRSTSADVIVISYETARSEMSGVLALLGRKRTALVLDESHAVKNRSSLTSIAAQHFGPRCEYRWLLSGTPITNSIEDVFAQVGIISGGKPLGSYDSFVATYSAAGPGAEALKKRIAPFVLRKTKADCLDLPDKTFVDLRVELPVWQRSLYDSMRDELVCQIRGMSGEDFRAFAPTALARLLRLSQLASNPALLLPTEPKEPAKFVQLDSLIDEIVSKSGEKLIVWSHYVQTIETLLSRYSALNPVAIYGAVEASDRQAIAQAFQTNPDVKILIGNPAAAGTGFTLTAARYAIYETLSWRYDFYAQSQDRIHRIGQGRPVTYLRLIAADTVEEVIVQALAEKSELARLLLGDSDAMSIARAFSPAQFCELLNNNRLPA